MRRVVVNVPEDKLTEFDLAMKTLGFKTTEEDITVPEWHKEIVRERIRTTREEDYIPWEEVQRKFRTKYGLED